MRQRWHAWLTRHQKKLGHYLTLVLDGWVDSNLPDEGSSSGRFHHVQAGVVGTVNVGRGCKRMTRHTPETVSWLPLMNSMIVSFCLPHHVAVSAFIICSALCACTEMWMCVLYVSFWCVAMGSAVLFILRSKLLLYSAGYGVNRMQVVLSGFSVRLFCPGKNFM